MRRLCLILLGAGLLLTAGNLHARVDARMLRYPDVSQSHITFVYAGDIWVLPREGGTAHRLSSPEGEEMFPRFSPDGSTIAFSGNYDGNMEVYTIPTLGGTPTRLTHHGMGDRTVDWHPDGTTVLYASSMESGRQRYNQLYLAPGDGGMPDKLPVPYAEFGAISPDGSTLAFMPISRAFRTWKRYRGGMAPDIWFFDLQNQISQNITDHPANDMHPMWYGETLYFLSDRGPNSRYNIWSYHQNTQEFRQVTHFEDFDIHFPAIGPADIVFETGGRLYLMALPSEEYHTVDVNVVTDETTLKPRTENVEDHIRNAWIAPDGKRALVEARGDVFSIPAEHGYIENLTRSPGVAERTPAWSPDGKKVAYWSDRSGEYELTLRNLDNPGEQQQLTSYGAGFKYQPYWSPDSKKLAFIDQSMTIRIYNAEEDQTVEVDQALWMYHGELENFSMNWSADSRWLTYHRGLDNQHGAIFLYDTNANQRHQVTSGYYDDALPAFDPDGKYLYYLTNRHFSPSYSDIDNSFIYPNTTQVVAVSLREDVPSPLAPRNDEVEMEEDEEEEQENGNDEEETDAEEQPVEIDLEGFEQRVT
ncbi:MAG TPA: peptidase S41, partial [bacterium]|nr:peptidase S41 [bacterium]